MMRPLHGEADRAHRARDPRRGQPAPASITRACSRGNGWTQTHQDASSSGRTTTKATGKARGKAPEDPVRWRVPLHETLAAAHEAARAGAKWLLDRAAPGGADQAWALTSSMTA